MMIEEKVAMQLLLLFLPLRFVSSEDDAFLKVVTAEGFPVLNRHYSIQWVAWNWMRASNG